MWAYLPMFEQCRLNIHGLDLDRIFKNNNILNLVLSMKPSLPKIIFQKFETTLIWVRYIKFCSNKNYCQAILVQVKKLYFVVYELKDTLTVY